ncbi:alpha/beta fold hydrolase [Streptomyces mirabilis]|uniref:alpha/beta fold hydrolase n=1 Tax=Streptomyces mirabilis TaxID=68239 RepID=UPI002F9160EB
MLGRETRDAVARLAAAVLSVRPLVEELAAPVRVTPGTRTGTGPCAWPPGRRMALRRLLERVARGTGVPVVLAPKDDPRLLGLFERVVSDRLALADWADTVVPADLLGEVDDVVAGAVAAGFDTTANKRTLPSPDGTPLNIYSAGEGPEAVVLVPACGMPAALAEPWIRYLAADRRVLTWESRGLFGAHGSPGDYRWDLDAQVDDLFAVLDHHGVKRAHAVGLCGGAVIALAAAAEHPERIMSLSLWHGAYGFAADDYPTTSHQAGLIELMTAAARDRAAARAVHAAFCQAVLTSTSADVAHLVLHPYASPELLYRYCRLNTGITGTDVEPLLPRVPQPTLVVTSKDDDIAAPLGSKRVAGGLPNGQLLVEEHGDHISVFNADDLLLSKAERFMSRHPGR